ncbi:MAG: hypothetical protein ACERKO_12050 [Acetanaerobacterium sp.]
MIVECVTITAILMAIFFVFLRGRKPKSALSTIPIIIVPMMHLAGSPISQWLSPLFGVQRLQVYVALDVFAFMLFALISIIMLKNFHSKRTRITYMIACGVFTLTLSVILITDLFTQIG